MRRIILILTLALSLTACAEESKPKLAADRPPTLGEVRDRELSVVLSYPPPHVAPFWAAWRGRADVSLRGPEAGLDQLPASLSLGDGFGDLDDCLSGQLDGSWSLGAGGALTIILPPGKPGASHLSFSGTLAVRSYLDGDVIRRRLVGSGTWAVVAGAACEPDDFAGGLTGAFTCEQPERQGVEAGEGPVGPRARLLLIRDDGQVTSVEGPARAVVAVARRITP